MRRVHILPFDQSFAGHAVDTGLPNKLWQEAPGILQWGIEGAKRLYEEKRLTKPESVENAVQRFRAEMDVVGSFIRERCVVSPATEYHATMLYNSFAIYAREMGLAVLSQSAFGQQLTRRGYAVRHTSTGDFRKGLTLRPSVGLEIAA